MRSGTIATPKASPLVELCRRKWRARVHHSPFPTQRGESCRSAPTSPTRAPPPRGHEVPLLSVAHSPLPVLVQRASMGNCVRVGGTQPDPQPPRESMSPRGRPVARPHGHPPPPAAYTEPAYHFGIPRDPSAPARPGDPPRDLFPPILGKKCFTARARSSAGPPRTEECAADPSADLSTTTPPGSIRPGPTLPHACGAR